MLESKLLCQRLLIIKQVTILKKCVCIHRNQLRKMASFCQAFARLYDTVGKSEKQGQGKNWKTGVIWERDGEGKNAGVTVI